MADINYKIIQMMKKSDKAAISFAALDDYDYPVIVKQLQEANPSIYRVLSGLQSPHLPHIFAVEESEKELLVIEEYIDGRALDEYLQEENLSEVQVLELLIQLCEALETLHSCEPPVIHRDIKPSNILIDKNDVVKVIDFDASRQYKGTKTTSDTRLLGTIEYAAPEQFGYTQTDPRSDIYSLGVVFSEIKAFETVSWIRAWKHIVDKCTSFDPENRYQDVTHVKKDLIACLRRAKHPRRTAVVSLGIALTVCIIAGLWILFANEETMAPPTEPSATPGNSPITGPTLTPTSVPSPTVTLTPSPTPYPAYEGIVLLEDELVWNVTEEKTKVIRLHPEAPCSIKKVYICRRAQAEDPYSEVREILEENTYVLSGNRKELELFPDFFATYPEVTEAVLYLEFNDGRGERAWIQFTE